MTFRGAVNDGIWPMRELSGVESGRTMASLWSNSVSRDAPTELQDGVTIEEVTWKSGGMTPH